MVLTIGYGGVWRRGGWNGDHTINLTLVGCRSSRVETQSIPKILDKLEEPSPVGLQRVNPREWSSQHIRLDSRCEYREEVEVGAPSELPVQRGRRGIGCFRTK